MTTPLTYPFPGTPEAEILARVQLLKQHMETGGITAVFLTHKPDIFYFSGTAQDCYLYIHLDHDPILFVKRYYPRAVQESPLKSIFKISSIKNIPETILDLHQHLPETCGLAFDVVPVRDFHFYQKLFNPTIFCDTTFLINECRQIKSTCEINLLKASARLSEKTFAHIRTILRPGISEMELSGEIEIFARKFGHSGTMLGRNYRAVMYPFHILSGTSGGLAGAVDTPCSGTGTSALHPSGAGPRKIKENDPVLIDFGTILNGYHMDETRMFAIGSMETKALDASKAAIEILQTLVAMMKPGMVINEVFHASIATAVKLGYEKQFLGLPGIKSNFIGHGLGLELVEAPVISKGNRDTLKPGMVLALEPKFIFKNQFAAGVESVVHITTRGAEYLTTIPHDIFIC